MENDARLDSAEQIVIPLDSSISVSVLSNNSEAFVEVTSPENGGADVTFEQLTRKLAEEKIVYGISEDTLREIADLKQYNRKIRVAKWTPPVNGTDGTITYNFDKQVDLKPVEDEHGFVDYKNLGLIRNVLAGTVIAEITHPTEGTPGTDVRGTALRQIMGKKAAMSIGSNTYLSEDGTKIIASSNGNLCYKSGGFYIENVCVINGDVDASTGNINFLGDVLVKGEVMEGFSVTSKGNISVNGNVNNATLVAERSVLIKKGCIYSKVDCKDEFSANFCEYSKINCAGDVTSQSFVVCDVFAEGLIVNKGANGGLLGGKYTSLKGIEANSIGTKNYTPTALSIGNNALLTLERDDLLVKSEAVNKQIEDVRLIVDFLNNKKKEGHKLDAEKEQLLGNAARQKILLSVNLKDIQKRIAAIEEDLKVKQNLSVSCRGKLYPGVRIVINDIVHKNQNEYTRCKVYLGEDGEFTFGQL